MYQVGNFIKKETLPQVFPCELCKSSKGTFFTEHLGATASEYCSRNFEVFCIYTSMLEANVKFCRFEQVVDMAPSIKWEFQKEGYINWL